jgi:hypothetical protein
MMSGLPLNGLGRECVARIEPRAFPDTGAARDLFHRLFRRCLLQPRDQVAALLRIRHVDAHALAGRDAFRVGQPAIERLFVPDLT